MISKIETHGDGNMTERFHFTDFSKPSPTMLGVIICHSQRFIFLSKEAEVSARGIPKSAIERNPKVWIG